MKNLNKSTVIIASSTLILGLLLGWFIFGKFHKSPVDEHNHTEASSSTIWTCSMHPQVRKNEPGDCPICGMELIPLEKNTDEIDPMAVSMSQTAMQLAQIETMVVGKKNAEKSIRLTGKVQADERLLYTQSSHLPGRIEKLTVNFTGDFVSAGQVIAYIYSPELVTAQEELFEAQKIKETQPGLFKSAKEKLKNWKLTENQIHQILTSGKTMEEFPILANVSGYVTKKMVNLGDYIKTGQAVYQIADLSKVWVLFDVYESDMTWVKKGASISYTIPSNPGKTFDGIVSYIDPVIDPKTRVAKARVEAGNKNLLLKPEMFANGIVQSNYSETNSLLTVPKSAVMWTGKRSVVYVMQNTAQGVSFLMREVTLGPELAGGYEIESGLEPGEEIAINGTFSIDAAAQLAGKPSMMNPEGGMAMTGHNHGGNTHVNMENGPMTSKKISVTVEVKEALKPLFVHYFSMKEALVNDDFDKAKESGVELSKLLDKVDMNLFKGDAHSVWMQHSSVLKQSIQHIEHLSEIKTVRENFISISKIMIAIVESFDPIATPIYVQHCPMADSNKGADWLSKEKDILNPYFGQAMLSCGETTKTIK